ncbi:hypothetical protein [Dongshaea marina]|uniref:hypothetical protein n=1 Tax=Dongshaea marina TaxID=2047966 RepID=UPI00131EF09C|nr:hypothetical protein [Dongshaea marina]
MNTNQLTHIPHKVLFHFISLMFLCTLLPIFLGGLVEYLYHDHSSYLPESLRPKDIPGIIQQIDHLLPEQKEQKLQQLSKRYGVPFELKPPEISSPSLFHRTLQIEGIPMSYEGRTILSIPNPYGDTLQIGPLPLKFPIGTSWVNSRIKLLAVWLLFCALLFSVVTYLYLRSHFQDLLKLNQTSSKLAAGDMNARCYGLTSPCSAPFNTQSTSLLVKLRPWSRGGKR